MVTFQVEARYCNKLGSVTEYSLLVLDEADGYFPLDGVPPDQIYMHFFPGSRVNIKWKKAQVSIVDPFPESCLTSPACQRNATQAALRLTKLCFGPLAGCMNSR